MRNRVLALALALAAVGCTATDDPVVETNTEQGLTLTSSAFEPGGVMPAKYTCDGQDVSPPLEWTGNDAVTAGPYAVVLEDEDADGFLHWFVYGIGSRALLEGNVRAPEGRNDFGDVGYGGPCPPEGDGAHHYVFHVYQLRPVPSPIEPGQRPSEILGPNHENVVAMGTLTVTYER